MGDLARALTSQWKVHPGYQQNSAGGLFIPKRKIKLGYLQACKLVMCVLKKIKEIRLRAGLNPDRSVCGIYNLFIKWK